MIMKFLYSATSSFHSAVRSRMDAVINALDNVAARLYVDRGFSFFFGRGGGGTTTPDRKDGQCYQLQSPF